MIKDFAEQKELQMIIFQLNNEEYAVPITCVQEIIMPQNLTKIPKSPDFVQGMINLRGRIIPVIDGRKKFQIETKTTNSAESRIMVLEVESQTIGLIVDAVSEVIYLQTQDIEPPPIDLGEDSDFLWGVGKFKDRLLILIDTEKFLTLSEFTQIKSLTKVSETAKAIAENLSNELVTQ